MGCLSERQVSMVQESFGAGVEGAGVDISFIVFGRSRKLFPTHVATWSALH
jgi:hypothetical protein